MNKKNKILLIIFLLLLTSAIFYQKKYKTWSEEVKSEKNFLAGLNFDGINKIQLTKDKKEISLEKENNRWKVSRTKFYVKDGEIEDVLGKLKEASSKQLFLASTNKDKKNSYKTDDSGIYVRLKEGNKDLADFIIGRFSTDGSFTYLGQRSSNKTYQIQGNLNSLFNKSDWRDNLILSFDKENINKIRIQRNKNNIFIEKRGDDWFLNDKQKTKLAKNKIEELLISASLLEADKIGEQTFKNTGLEKNTLIIQFLGKNINQTLMFGNKTKEGVYVKRGDSDNIYLISADKFNYFNKSEKDLK